jgi:hypothetical protein
MSEAMPTASNEMAIKRVELGLQLLTAILGRLDGIAGGTAGAKPKSSFGGTSISIPSTRHSPTARHLLPQERMGEDFMTTQSVWASAFVAGKDLAKVSFWRRLLIAIMDGRQRKADEFLREYLRMHRDENRVEK